MDSHFTFKSLFLFPGKEIELRDDFFNTLSYNNKILSIGFCIFLHILDSDYV